MFIKIQIVSTENASNGKPFLTFECATIYVISRNHMIAILKRSFVGVCSNEMSSSCTISSNEIGKAEHHPTVPNAPTICSHGSVFGKNKFGVNEKSIVRNQERKNKRSTMMPHHSHILCLYSHFDLFAMPSNCCHNNIGFPAIKPFADHLEGRFSQIQSLCRVRFFNENHLNQVSLTYETNALFNKCLL